MELKSIRKINLEGGDRVGTVGNRIGKARNMLLKGKERGSNPPEDVHLSSRRSHIVRQRIDNWYYYIDLFIFVISIKYEKLSVRSCIFRSTWLFRDISAIPHILASFSCSFILFEYWYKCSFSPSNACSPYLYLLFGHFESVENRFVDH